MVDSSLQSKDELLIPDIDGIMALWSFLKKASKHENRRKLDLSILVYIIFCRGPLEEIRSHLSILKLPKCPR